MSFCASCGRQRSGTGRFCAGCGAEFGDSPTVSADQGADSTWQPTQTVHATPPQAPGYPPSGFTSGNPFSSADPITPPAPPFPAAPPTGPPPVRDGRRWLFIVVAVVVVLAAGGGAYALASALGKNSTAQPSDQPTVGTSTSAGSSPATVTTPPSSPATSPTQTPSPTLSLVSISPSVTAGAAEPQVETLLSHYFHGINAHDYAEYAGTLTPAQLVKQPQSTFDSGYSSTSDSGMTLTTLADNGSGGLTATVTFTSHQSPAQSVDHSACNAWTLNLYLVAQANGYLIGPAPSGYQPIYSDC